GLLDRFWCGQSRRQNPPLQTIRHVLLQTWRRQHLELIRKQFCAIREQSGRCGFWGSAVVSPAAFGLWSKAFPSECSRRDLLLTRILIGGPPRPGVADANLVSNILICADQGPGSGLLVLRRLFCLGILPSGRPSCWLGPR